MATVIKKGIKFIKINKTDSNGKDKTPILQQLTNIRVSYSDIGIVQYDVYGKTEYPSYFLYKVDYKNTTSSVDQGIFDYTLNATDSSTYNVYSTETQVTNFPISTYMDGIYYSIPSSQHYQNVTLTYTASIDYTIGGAKASPELRLYFGDTFIKKKIDTEVTTPGTLTLSGSLTLLQPGYTGYNLRLATDTAFNPVNFTNAKFKVSQSTLTTGNNPLLVVPSPNTSLKFTGTDCDVTAGWTDQYPLSQYFMDVDYSTGLTIPTNQTGLVSGSATKAPVKDYYYNLAAQVYSRYKGARAYSLKYNEYSDATNNPNIGTAYKQYPAQGYAGDSSYGRTAAIDRLNSYAARFQYIAGYGPEMYNALLLYVTDTVDETGTVKQPKLGDPTYYNLRDTFESGQYATVKLLDAQGLTQFASLNSTFKIIKAGKRIETPLYTYTGSAQYTSNPTPYVGIQFQGVGNPPGITSRWYTSSVFYSPLTQILDQNFVALTHTGSTIQFNDRFQQDKGYKLLTGDNQSLTPLSFGLTATVSTTQGYDNWVNIKFVSSSTAPTTFPGAVGSYGVIQDFGNNIVPQNSIQSIALTTQPINVQEGAYYYFIIAETSDFGGGGYTPNLINYTIQTFQQNLPTSTADYDVTFAGGPYLITSSTDPGLLSASVQLANYENRGYKQQPITNAGFNEPIVFSIQEGDEIRFGGDEANTHLIYNVQRTNGQLTFRVDPPLSTREYNISMSNAFSIRRYTDDPNIVILAGTKPAGGTPGGILQPQYATNKLLSTLNDSKIFTLQSGQSNN